jgi:beta-1,4-mannosyl-glycoprotein beta-1,4-N-acetylglucosaminyltransferase
MIARILKAAGRRIGPRCRPLHRHVSGLRRRRLIDCFLFYNELDLLELRLKTMHAHVDHFVVAECPLTMAGDPKPLFFAENKERFAPYLDKIVHVVIPPAAETDYTVLMQKQSSEAYQRNALSLGFSRFDDRDIIMISDVDEIVDPDCLRKVRGAINCGVEFLALRQHWHLLYLNARVVARRSQKDMLDPCKWFGTLCCNRKVMRTVFHDRPHSIWARKWGKAGHNLFLVDNGGWHLSYLGGVEKVMNKLKATVLQEVGARDAQDLADKVFVGAKFEFIPIDHTFPKPVQANPGDYASLCLNPADYSAAIQPFLELWQNVPNR